MNKSELITVIAERTELTKKDTEKFVNAFVETVTEALASGDKVQLIGFGTFETRHRAEREGHNPQTGEKLIVPARNAPAFKAGKALKDAVNQ